MESIKKECTPLKRDYDACFLKWFSDKYLKGDQDDDCGDLFVKYQECVLVETFQYVSLPYSLSKGSSQRKRNESRRIERSGAWN
eukprot:m.20017 g.20017  ORF g.20017 m.20017 type:complete len:84 (+) comp27954_c0_seq1:170-421(+)